MEEPELNVILMEALSEAKKAFDGVLCDKYTLDLDLRLTFKVEWLCGETGVPIEEIRWQVGG